MVMRFHATLPAPPGINHAYGVSPSGHWYLSRKAAGWEDDALLLLRQAGFREQPAGWYWLAVALRVYTIGLDCDAPIKLVLDVIEDVLGIDDRMVGELRVVKHFVRHRAEQKLAVACTVLPVADRDEFTALSERAAAGEMVGP